MMSVKQPPGQPPSDVKEIIREFSGPQELRGGSLRVSAYLTNDLVFVSGLKNELEDFKAFLRTKKMPRHIVNHLYGYHHPMLEGMAIEFRKAVDAVSFQDPQVTVLSNYTGNPFTKADAKDLLVRQIFNPIRINTCIQNALGMGCNVFVDVGSSVFFHGLRGGTGQRDGSRRPPTPRQN